MPTVRAYAAPDAKSPLKPFSIERREPGPHDVVIDVTYCGVCHSDIHTVRDEWGGTRYPVVPGHEIAGRVTRVGAKVTRFKVGETAGVGCYVDSCRECDACRDGDEQYCEKALVFTYNGTEKDGRGPTQGGYSTSIVVDENYVFRLPGNLPLERVAPLLCAGITTYSPMRHFGVAKGQRVAVVGLGGLGHMAVKIAASMGASVDVLSSSRSKEADAKRLGASGFIATREPGALEQAAGRFDFILDTVSAAHDIDAVLSTLKRNGTMVLVGAPEKPHQLAAFALIGGRRRLAGSLIGGVQETQEMLDYCGRKNIGADVEVISASQINEAYDRAVRGDVRFRFVIDAKTL